MQPGAQSFLRKGDADQHQCGSVPLRCVREGVRPTGTACRQALSPVPAQTHTHTFRVGLAALTEFPDHLHYELTPCMLAQTAMPP